MRCAFCIIAILTAAVTLCAAEDAGPAGQVNPARGYRLLTRKAYLPPDFDQVVFDELWKTWEVPLRAQAEQGTLDTRRRIAFARYGLTAAEGNPQRRPLQYVVDAQGNWTMNCLACHQGKVAGRHISGVPNSLFALETLTEEVRQTKVRLKKPLARMDVGSLFMPLGTSNGTTNAVMFGVTLMSHRDAQLNVLPLTPPPKLTHNDEDPPAWWLLKKKRRIYADGFATKSHRALMQFMLVRLNGPERFREWEDDYRDILAWIESLEPPSYPFSIDRQVARAGETVFNKHCAECHGTYGRNPQYPNRIVPIEVVNTDPTRLRALSAEHRSAYARSWFTHFDPSETLTDPGGYLAPPLDGVWASAPYFHNGSVPTLWHVLHPDSRPAVWLRSEDGYDRQRVGLEITTFDKMPKTSSRAERRRYFDTSSPSKSAAGHRFPDALTEPERAAVLEYLKSL